MEKIQDIRESSFAIINNNGKQEIYAWGFNNSGQLGLGDLNNRSAPTLLDSSSLGSYTSIEELIVRDGGTIMATVNTTEGKKIYVWGYNIFGQLGIGNTTNQSSPILFDTAQFGDDRIKIINFGSNGYQRGYSSYAILSTSSNIDKIYVWGLNNSGQLGLGDTNDRLTPTLFDTTLFKLYENIIDFNIFNTSYAVVGIPNSNNVRLYMWGDNARGQCATGDKRTVTIPFEVLGLSSFKFIRIFGSTVYFVTNESVNKLFTWGFNQNSQTGNGATGDVTSIYNVPQSQLGGATEISEISGSWYNAFAQVIVNGVPKIYVWGYNATGALGLGDINNRTTPTLFDNSRLGNFTEIYESSFDSKYWTVLCLFAYVKTTSGDRLYTWGSNDYGNLGLGDTVNRYSPTQVTSLNLSTAKIKNFTQTNYLSFKLTLEGNGQPDSSYVAGENNYGQAGLGNTTYFSSFTPVLPTRYTNPRSKVIPTTNLTSSQALELINPNNTLNRTELEKYVDTTSFPPGATLSIDPATTTSDYKNGILNLGIRTNQYNKLMIVNPVSTPKTFNVTIPGFRPVTDVNTNPVSVIIRDADGNNIDKIYDQLVDSTYKVINRDLLEYYFDLSSIPPNAVIHLYRTSFGNDTEATFTLTSSQVYGNNGLIVSNQLYVKTDLVWTFTSSQLNLALVISLSVVGGLLLIGAIIAIMLVRRSSNRLII